VLILDEPTRGIDVGAKAEVHHLIGESAAAGVGIVLISSELPEVLAASDRILVIADGEIVKEFARADANEDDVMLAATRQTGGKGDPPPLSEDRP
jgi:ABC-type sugar transport system ATPase subunit